MLEFKEEFIIKYLEGNYSPEEEKQLLEWLKASEENRNLLLNYKKVFSLRNIEFYSQTDRMNLALSRFYNNIEDINKKQKRSFFIKFLKYAAFIVFIISISILTLHLKRKQNAEIVTLIFGSSDSIRSVILPDGSKVWLNTNSSFRYPLSFSDKERNVFLEGEAYFEVTPDSTKPFIVTAGAIHVKVLGTSFNINTLSCNNAILTTLVTGKVSILDSNGKDITRMQPGQMAIYYKAENKLDLRQVNATLYTSWHQGLFTFEKARLAEITKKIQEIYGVNIIVNSGTKTDAFYNFVFRKSQSLETVMEMLQFVAPIQYKISDKEIYINQK